jgi:hypothetical protein
MNPTVLLGSVITRAQRPGPKRRYPSCLWTSVTLPTGAKVTVRDEPCPQGRVLQELQRAENDTRKDPDYRQLTEVHKQDGYRRFGPGRWALVMTLPNSTVGFIQLPN